MQQLSEGIKLVDWILDLLLVAGIEHFLHVCDIEK